MGKVSFSWGFKRFILFLVYKTNILFKLLKQENNVNLLINFFFYILF